MDKSLHGWAEMSETIQMPIMTGEYDTDIRADYDRISEFSLPTYDRLLLTPREFILHVDEYNKSFCYPAYYAQVYPKTAGLKKFNIMNIKSIYDVIPFLYDNISKYLDMYLLLVSEFEENIYGGSVMSNGNSLYIDIVKGLQNQIAYGRSPICSCNVRYGSRPKYKGKESSFMYSLFDEIIENLSIYGDSHKSAYLDGYFEFAFTRPIGTNELRLVFFDFKNEEKFYNVR